MLLVVKTGSDDRAGGGKDTLATGNLPAGVPVRSRSQCEPWREALEQGWQAGLSAQRLYQDLVTGHQFAGSYDTVKRFVRRLAAQVERPFVRMEVEPGAGAQVDSGLGAWVLVDGKRKRPHLFRIVLSHSRKAYSEVVWRQTTGSFIRCLENAFCYFGSVLKTLVIDNLRAAVTRAENKSVRSLQVVVAARLFTEGLAFMMAYISDDF